jgi:hypothetical protein
VDDPCVVIVVLISVVGFVGNCCLWLCVVLSSILFVCSRLLWEEVHSCDVVSEGSCFMF